MDRWSRVADRVGLKPVDQVIDEFVRVLLKFERVMRFRILDNLAIT
jgi:hypothetical protein